MKRLIYRMRYGKGEGWLLVHGDSTIVIGDPKAKAIRWCRRHCRAIWRGVKAPVQLLIYNKNGRIGREASYGCDSKRRKG